MNHGHHEQMHPMSLSLRASGTLPSEAIQWAFTLGCFVAPLLAMTWGRSLNSTRPRPSLRAKRSNRLNASR
ncbi:MAG: hypothetical protein LBT00_10615 [Spirochaetaceae bacterium]|nr:hypothetical protein [Spirochaetaceae bacterium]